MKDATTGFELEPTVEVLAAQAFFFFLAGSDTTAGTMHFTLLELSNNPPILKRVHDEIDKVFHNKDQLNFEDIDKLQYLEMVVNEAMRMYPPIGLMQRKCTKDTKLPVGGLKVEKDCLVLIPVYAVHRDENHYPNSDVFDPERFSPENVKSIPKFAYMPFGEGNRICLGMRFARLQVLAGLAWLLRRYTLRPQNVRPQSFEPSVFALRAPHVRFGLVPRNLTP
ncbi:cytochrome p450 domain-containing protein [Phthorimaea operculella]|nr:cytochrome p450 domain-containing protein [Phthorimaea operculella]